MVGAVGRGVLRVVSPDQLSADERAKDLAGAAAEDAAAGSEGLNNDLASFVEGELQKFRRHRDSSAGWSDRLIAAMRAFKGQYDSQTLTEIAKFGGSQIYARVTAAKCRGASSLLRDVYLGPEKPWGLEATPDPVLPDDVTKNVTDLVNVEVSYLAQKGQPPSPEMIRDRTLGLMSGAKNAAIKKARLEAKKAQDKLDDILVEGNFYEALSDLIIDLPLFPFACIKGPVVRMTPQVTWEGGKAVSKETPKLFWYRVSPFDLWWTPGVSSITDAAVIERVRLTRVDLNQLLGLPGYNEDAIRGALMDYGASGYSCDSQDSTQTERADMESRESPSTNESGIIDMVEYHGYVLGSLLIDWGMSAEEIPDPDKDYFVDVYKVGKYVIKAQVSASVRKRAPYYLTSFEKVPGTMVGNALPDILGDVQSTANATLRALVNNMAMSSGPQVVVNDEAIAPNENSDELYPWKRWHVVSDPMRNNMQDPVKFTDVPSNAQELLTVYKEMMNMADDLSAIPKYVTGSDRLGGAGRTASGLAMLMGNAAKILQTVASNVDKDVVRPSVTELYDMVMLTDTTGLLRGDESIKVLGVNVAVQRETQRQRQLEFLQLTANPIDMQILGIPGRAKVLRSVSDGIGLQGDDIVPPDDVLATQNMPPPGPQGGAPGGVSQQPAPQEPQGPSTNVVQ